MKKLSIIGRGTAGCFAVTHFLKHTDWEIDWYFDSSISPQAVGEGSTVDLPPSLFTNIGFTLVDLEKIYGTFKAGIKKQGWGKDGREFYHFFVPGQISYHFNAVKLQEYIFEKVCLNPRVRIIDANITDHSTIDSDFVFDCSGKPSNFNDFVVSENIPVNSVHVTQCYWDLPRFQYTLTLARPYGWVFGIPLRNRCSIGYLYNNKINSLDEVKEDVKDIFRQYELTPSQDTNSFSFGNYYRKENFQGRSIYSGNASFFLEPLEATSIYCMNQIQFMALSHWKGGIPRDQANIEYSKLLNGVEDVIMLHYFESPYKTRFWEMAKERSRNRLRFSLGKEGSENLKAQVRGVVSPATNMDPARIPFHGSWNHYAFSQNLENLGISRDLYIMSR